MKIALFGSVDATWEKMIHDGGHEVHSIWLQPMNHLTASIVSLAEKQGSAIQFQRINRQKMLDLAAQGVELLISIGYPFLIPTDTPLRGLNVHPSLLPDGRGPFPIPAILKEHRDAAGFTVHKLSARFDSGDIVYQEKFELGDHDTCDTLLIRMYMRSSGAMRTILKDLPNHWDNAKAQTAAPQWEARGLSPEFFRPELSLEENVSVWRIYGAGGTLIRIGDLTAPVTGLAGWKEAHTLEPGTVLSRDEYRIVIAVSDGFAVVMYKSL